MAFGRLAKDRLACKRVARHIQAYLDGELVDPESVARVVEHLEACGRCGLDLETYRTLKDSLGRLSRPVDGRAVERLRTFVSELERTGTEEFDEWAPGRRR